jgi:hypothetical protein
MATPTNYLPTGDIIRHGYSENKVAKGTLEVDFPHLFGHPQQQPFVVVAIWCGHGG